MYCMYCGQKLPEGAMFCSNCVAPKAAETPKEAPKPSPMAAPKAAAPKEEAKPAAPVVPAAPKAPSPSPFRASAFSKPSAPQPKKGDSAPKLSQPLGGLSNADLDTLKEPSEPQTLGSLGSLGSGSSSDPDSEKLHSSVDPSSYWNIAKKPSSDQPKNDPSIPNPFKPAGSAGQDNPFKPSGFAKPAAEEPAAKEPEAPSPFRSFGAPYKPSANEPKEEAPSPFKANGIASRPAQPKAEESAEPSPFKPFGGQAFAPKAEPAAPAKPEAPVKTEEPKEADTNPFKFSGFSDMDPDFDLPVEPNAPSPFKPYNPN